MCLKASETEGLVSSQARGTCLSHSASCAPGLGQVHALEAHVYLEVSSKYVPQSKYVCLKASSTATWWDGECLRNVPTQRERRV